MNNYAHIASRVLNTPLLLEPGYARVFFSALSSRLGIASLNDADGPVEEGLKIRVDGRTYNKTRVNAWGDEEVLFQVVEGVALLDVKGTLVHKHGYLKPFSGMTGYDGIINRTAMMFAETDVKGVLMDLHTPGGEVSGCFDTVDRLRQMSEQAGKPIWSICNDMACSGGMALASAGSRRLITQTGMAGSVGVVMAHASYQEALKEAGIKVTLIHSGAHKVEGNPYEDLPDEVLARFQSDTHALRQHFAELVARHIGLSTEAVLATEAAVYRGQAAIDVGFADALVNGHEAIAEFSEHLSTPGRVITTGATMSTQETTTGAGGAPAVSVEGAQPDPKAERERVRGILGHAEAKGRSGLAEHLAYETDLSVEAAGAMLAKAPADGGSLDASTSLDRVMANESQPKVGADTAAGADEPSKAQKIVAAWQSAKGVKA
ncbi:S49 family peptidase [Metapseudomonas resinovorans]|uniref:S49 family peptidase n=1 Tax=Metapseudomonas resinovorans TaxID=53412 RepID=UPI00041F23A4|nr:S49 family peptidase [Pseudomonas resinovorans]